MHKCYAERELDPNAKEYKGRKKMGAVVGQGKSISRMNCIFDATFTKAMKTFQAVGKYLK